MTPEEYLYCIKYINPLAHVVIWGEGEEMYPKCDDAHVGVKPTLQECEAVLPQVQKTLKERNDRQAAREAAFKRLIEREMKAK